MLPRHPRIPAVVTGGQDTVALRVPDHPLTLSLLRAFGRGLVAPSANRFGGISPTAAAHVREEFGERVAVILDGGPCTVGIESTILDLSGEPPAILRPGAITAEALAAVLGQPPATGGTGRPRVPGSLARHYAPRTPLRLAPRPELEAAPPGTLLLAIGRLPPGRRGLALPAAPEAYARGLYAALRALDREGAALILVERPPEDPAWSAIRDRLRRAAG
ncbi:MAG: L-threonylcarbamoyladenylate synthase [Xanthomonadales bacterium]|nr:L-threonylcarbamoyladenylate synthase [Xanthomonadales bacterium]